MHEGPTPQDVVEGMVRRGADEGLIAAYRSLEGIRPPAVRLETAPLSRFGYRVGEPGAPAFRPMSVPAQRVAPGRP